MLSGRALNAPPPIFSMKMTNLGPKNDKIISPQICEVTPQPQLLEGTTNIADSWDFFKKVGFFVGGGQEKSLFIKKAVFSKKWGKYVIIKFFKSPGGSASKIFFQKMVSNPQPCLTILT